MCLISRENGIQFFTWSYPLEECTDENDFSNEGSYTIAVFKIKIIAYSWYICLMEVRAEEDRSQSKLGAN